MKRPGQRRPRQGRVPTLMVLCLECHCHVHAPTKVCPHCGADVQRLLKEERKQLLEVRRLTVALEKLMQGGGVP